MISLQVSPHASPGFIGLILIPLMFVLVSYISKASHTIKIVFSVLFILFLFVIGLSIYAELLRNLDNLVSILLLFITGILLSYFFFSVFKIYELSKVGEKTKTNVIRRKKLVGRLGYIVAIAISCFIVGIAFTALLDLGNGISIQKWGNDVLRVSFFSTMVVVLMDGIISKICTPIYTADQIQYLDRFNLYLRSFNADNVHRKDEEYICKTFNLLFPTYAIGDPNTLLQPYGADRIYASNTEWKESVSTLMSKAQIIIIRCGLTSGTIWEIDKIFSSSYIEKCVFIIDNASSFNLLSSKFAQFGITINIPEIFFDYAQYGLYVYKHNQTEWDTILYEIGKKSDVEKLINEILKVNPQVDKEYTKILNIRHKSMIKLFSKDIPKSVKYSLNWGIVSPLINMRHWPSIYWILSIGLIIAGGFLFKSMIPAYIVISLLFLFGNRIEWTQMPNSSPIMFLKKQNREASIMWISMLSSSILAFLCLMFLVLIK